jgi:uncharacterized protein (TIGR03089 family)
VTPSDLLRDALVADPARPLVTFYDDATGERVELSVATFANWVAKTANLLQEELSAGPGTRMALRLPAHWQAAVLLAAAWEVGATVTPGGAADGADVAVVGPTEVDLPGAPETLAVALRPLGAGFGGGLPAGVVDYAGEVLGHGDRFQAWTPVPAGTPLLGTDGGMLDGPGVVSAARGWGLEPGTRLLSDLPLSSGEGALVLPAVLVAGGSVVLCRNLDERRLEDRVAAERVTAVRR